MLYLLPAAIKAVAKKELNDVIMDLIDLMTQSKGKIISGIKSLPFPEFELMTKMEYGYWVKQQNYSEYDAFKVELEKLNAEIDKRLSEIKDIYLDDKFLTYLGKSNINLMEANHYLWQSIIPLKKLALIVEPDFTHSSSIHSRSKIRYELIKAYWINEKGEHIRNINHNIGNSEMEILDVAAKMFQSHGYDTMTPQKSYPNNVSVDMLITKNKSKWVVELVEKNRQKLIKSYASLYLWSVYKKEYGIQ